MSPKKIVNDLGDLMKLIPKWLRVSAVVIVASAASIFALGGLISDVVQATTQVPVIQKELNDSRHFTELRCAELQITLQKELNQSNQNVQDQIEQFTTDNQKDHSFIQANIAELTSDVKQIDKKSDQILSAIINSKTNDAIRNRVVK